MNKVFKKDIEAFFELDKKSQIKYLTNLFRESVELGCKITQLNYMLTLLQETNEDLSNTLNMRCMQISEFKKELNVLSASKKIFSTTPSFNNQLKAV
jgi:hypothetical protein